MGTEQDVSFINFKNRKVKTERSSECSGMPMKPETHSSVPGFLLSHHTGTKGHTGSIVPSSSACFSQVPGKPWTLFCPDCSGQWKTTEYVLCTAYCDGNTLTSLFPVSFTSGEILSQATRHSLPRTYFLTVSTLKWSTSLKAYLRGFPGGAVVENLPANAGDTGSSPGLGRSHMPRSN